MNNSNTPILQWEEGAGWLVLSGGVDSLSDIRALALNRMIPDGEIVYIGVDEDSAEEVIEDMGELGATTGFLVNVLAEDDESITEQISKASLIVIPAETDPRELQSILKGAALKSIKQAYKLGAVVLVEGDCASIFGHLYVVDGTGYDGFGWLRGALIVPGVTSVSDSDAAMDVLSANAASIAIGIGVGSALVLGPSGGVETWGLGEVTVVLGRG
ncbi:MAG: hypothetical protein GFH27_549367n49 [Chloroflexi bacterium AL-W]|nr:hypothetical protein [Chloroflexi bacterium AL-W]